jgi:hypothetical protein
LVALMTKGFTKMGGKHTHFTCKIHVNHNAFAAAPSFHFSWTDYMICPKPSVTNSYSLRTL